MTKTYTIEVSEEVLKELIKNNPDIAQQQRFVENEDGSVHDTVTGLTWGESTKYGDYTWDDAIETATRAGKRLPTSTELHEAFLAGVPGFLAGSYWSRTEVPGVSASAYRVGMYDVGFVVSSAKSGGRYVRCVS